MEHISVLKSAVQKYLGLEEGNLVVDGTLGLGGHALEILSAIGKDGVLIGFDQDRQNLEEAKKRLKAYEKQIVYINDNFRYLKTRLTENDIDQVDAILLDLGISSPHVDEADRGFSFMKEGPLDMRFDLDGRLTAADVVNGYEEVELAKIFFLYGEERLSRKFARFICERRKEKSFKTTTDLANFIESKAPKKYGGRKAKLHPATQIFQALRIEVNDELSALKEVLEQGMEVLEIGGRFVIISYHSLEDRIVKQFFRELERPKTVGEENLYRNFGEPIVERITKKPVTPDEEEVKVNPRSRSAKLRAYKKLKST